MMLSRICLIIVILLSVAGCIVFLITASLSGSEETMPSSKSDKTERESVAIASFRAMLNRTELYASFMMEDSYLIRWIKDMDFDLEKAAAKLKRSLQWRIENRIDTINEENNTDIYKHCPYDSNVRDRNGNIVVVVPFGKWKLRKVTVAGNVARMKRYIFQLIERLAAELRILSKSGNDIGVVGIMDLKGFSFIEHGCINCISVIANIISTSENHYPELIKGWYLVNVSRAAKIFLHSILQLLPSKLRKLTKIHGYNNTEWKANLMKTVDTDELPYGLGNK